MAAPTYESPLSSRYSSPQMQRFFSNAYKYGLWRRLWVALAEAQRDLGLAITDEQIEQLREYVDDIDFTLAREHEMRLKHDVMAHIHTYGDRCPKARGIIHLGATSCYVTDNADLIQMREALDVLIAKLHTVIETLAKQAQLHATTPCIGLTHLQPAQPTTMGKRMCLWLQDFVIDLQELRRCRQQLRFLGVKGAVGTQASFLNLFQGNHEKVEALDHAVAKKMHFEKVLTISGQTYTRKQDCLVANALGGLAISTHKCCTDIRLLASREELCEPSTSQQVGSSAMPHKRNPILSERACGLARFTLSLTQNTHYTAATQWMERSLDDSANRRLTIPELFLSSDGVLNLLQHLFAGLEVFENKTKAILQQYIGQVASEQILMHATQSGGDRQELHERLRCYNRETEGSPEQFLEKVCRDPAFNLSSYQQLQALIAPEILVGRASQQVDSFLRDEVQPVLAELESKAVDSYSVPY